MNYSATGWNSTSSPGTNIKTRHFPIILGLPDPVPPRLDEIPPDMPGAIERCAAQTMRYAPLAPHGR